MNRRRRPISAEVIAPSGVRHSGPGGATPVWVPWLIAPLFTLAPIAGCALAGKVKQSAIGPAAGDGVTLAAPAVTFGDPPPAPATAGPAVPVVPVAPTWSR